MRNPIPPEILRVTVSVLLGVTLTLGLFLLIAPLSQRHPAHEPVQAVLVVNLLAWESPVQSRPQPQADPPPRVDPIKPMPPKRIAQTPALKPPDKPSDEPPDAPLPTPAPQPSSEAAPNAARVRSDADADVQAMVEPVPFYRLTQTPRFLRKVAPTYPEAERAQGRGAEVRLKALIDAQGRVREVIVLESAGAQFDEAARAAILASRFAPARVGQRPVAVWLTLPVRFRLR